MKQEQKEIDLLLDRGFQVETKLFGKLKVWKTQKMTLGKLIELSDVFVKMKVENTDELNDVLAEQYISVKENAKNAAKVIAICVTNNKFIRPFLTRHFLNNISSSEMLDFAQRLIKQSDYQNFMLSIVLMNANRITKAQTVEKTEV